MTIRVASLFPAKRLKHVVSLRRSRVDGNEDDRPYVGLENIESWTGKLLGNSSATDEARSAIMVEGTSLSNTFEPGDVLFGKLRPYLAKVWVAEFPGRSTTEFLVMHPVEIEPRFLRYVCLWHDFVDAVDASTFGSKMPRADWNFIGNMSVPIPEWSKQRAIADYLDRETARLDTLVEEEERLLGLLAEKRRALITRAVTRGLDPNVPLHDSGISWLGDIPAHWTQSHLKRLLASMDYGISVSVETLGNVAVLRMGDIKDGEIDYSRIGFVDEVDGSLLLQPGDLVFNRTNSLDQIGKVALFRGKSDYPVSFASYLVRFRCSSAVLPEFLNWLLNSAYPLAWGRAQALPAIGQANLNPNRYGYLPTSLPSIAEQKEIVRYISNWTSRIDAVRAETQRTTALLVERRAALIAAAVTGQLEVT